MACQQRGQYNVQLVPVAGTPILSGIEILPDTGNPDSDFDSDGIPDVSDPDDDNDGIPDVWETAHGFNPKYAADAALDPDHDGRTNLQEYIAGTNPADSADAFEVSGVRSQGADFFLRFLTETGRLYGVAARDNLVGGGDWVILTNGMPGTGGYLEFRDPVTGARKFYRILVRLQ